MFIANNSSFKSIMQYLLARSIALKECYLMMNFEKNIRKNAHLMVKPLLNVIFWKVGYPNIFFQEICSSGGNQTTHKVSAAFIVKTAILEHP